MKVKTNYRQLKAAINKIMKAFKKTENRVIKFEAQNDTLSVSVNDAFGIKVTIPAIVYLSGVILTTEREVRNILFLPAWDNVLLSTDMDKNLVHVKWGDERDSTRMRLVEDDIFIGFRYPKMKTAKSCTIPSASFKSMAKDVLWICNDNGGKPSYRNVVKISFVQRDQYGDVSVVCTNGAAILKRKESVHMEGSFTDGEEVGVEVLASQLHRILSVLEDGELEFVFQDQNLFLKQRGIFIDAKEIVNGVMPNLQNILDKDRGFFTVNVKRNSLMDALLAVKEWRHDESAKFFIDFGRDIMTTEVSEGNEIIGSTMIAIETEGYDPKNPIHVSFNNLLMEKIIGVYPDETLSIQCSTAKMPFWMCTGKNGEYIYCILPTANC